MRVVRAAHTAELLLRSEAPTSSPRIRKRRESTPAPGPHLRSAPGTAASCRADLMHSRRGGACRLGVASCATRPIASANPAPPLFHDVHPTPRSVPDRARTGVRRPRVRASDGRRTLRASPLSVPARRDAARSAGHTRGRIARRPPDLRGVPERTQERRPEFAALAARIGVDREGRAGWVALGRVVRLARRSRGGCVQFRVRVRVSALRRGRNGHGQSTGRRHPRGLRPSCGGSRLRCTPRAGTRLRRVLLGGARSRSNPRRLLARAGRGSTLDIGSRTDWR